MLPAVVSRNNRILTTFTMLCFLLLPSPDSVFAEENSARIEKNLGCLRQGLLRVSDVLDKQAPMGRPRLFTKEDSEALKFLERYVEGLSLASLATDRAVKTNVKSTEKVSEELTEQASKISQLQTNADIRFAGIGTVLEKIMKNLDAMNDDMQDNIRSIKARLR